MTSAGPAATLYPRHAFEDILDAIDARHLSDRAWTSDEVVRRVWDIWDRETWIALPDSSKANCPCSFLVDDCGVWLNRPGQVDDPLTWHPLASLEDAGDDPKTSPVLPFPFSACQLAAYWAGGAASIFLFPLIVAAVKETGGDAAGAAMVLVPGRNQTAARGALVDAWRAWATAADCCLLDPLDEGIDADAMVRVLHSMHEQVTVNSRSGAGTRSEPVSESAEHKSAGDDCGVTHQRPVPMQRQQEMAILSELLGRGYSPSCLPKNAPGRAGVKSEIRIAMANRPGWVGTVFDKAWERLRRGGEIADA